MGCILLIVAVIFPTEERLELFAVVPIWMQTNITKAFRLAQT